MDRIASFASRVHIDLMDGIFTKNRSVDIGQIWLQEGLVNDVHLMFQQPEDVLDELLRLAPHLVVVHAESDCRIAAFAQRLHEADIQCGVALFPETAVEAIADSLLQIDHLLIFSGNLGHQGGSVANLELLQKVHQARAINPNLEIAWDGGVSTENISRLVAGGIDVVNVGGAIHHAPDAELAYNALAELLP